MEACLILLNEQNTHKEITSRQTKMSHDYTITICDALRAKFSVL